MSGLSRVRIRSRFFEDIFSNLKELMPEVYASSSFDGDDATVLSELYFKLSDDYKKRRVQPNHNTNDYKKCGVSIAAIMAMRPVQLGSSGKGDLRPFYCNPIFALACASSILNKPLSSMPVEDRDSFYAHLDTLKFPSTGPFLSDAAAQCLAPADQYSVSLSYDELLHIDSIVRTVKEFERWDQLNEEIHDQSHDV